MLVPIYYVYALVPNPIAREKAKRAKLAAIGVRHDRFQQYCIDPIDPAGDAKD